MLQRQILSAIFLSMALLALPSAVFSQKWGKITDEEWQLGAPEKYPEANTIILFDKASMKISLEGARTDHHVRIKILTKTGIDEVGNRSIAYYSKYEKVKNFKAQTITPDGKKHKVKKDAIFTKKAGRYSERSFAFPALEVGAIIEYRYKVTNERLRYLDPWFFQNDIYTLRSIFSVTLRAGFVYDVSYHNVPGPQRQPKIEESPDLDYMGPSMSMLRTFTWTVIDQPPVKNEPYMSAENDYRSALRFQLTTYEDRYNFIRFLKGWPKLGEDVQTSLDDFCNAKGDIKKLAKSICDSLSTELEKSQAIYDYVATHYRSSDEYTYWYFAHKKLSGLLEDGYGTPEEKNLLMLMMHKAVGINCWPVFISRREHAQFEPRHPDLRQFDYLLSFVEFTDGGFIYLDASSKLALYGVLPPSCLTDGGLLIDGKESQLVKIISGQVGSSRIDYTRMYIDDNGAAVCSTQCRFTGYYASSYSRWFEKQTSEEFVTERFLDRLGVQYELGEEHCDRDSLGDFVMKVDFSSAELTRRLDNNLLIKLPGFAFRNNPFKSEKRFFPVDFNYPFTYTCIVEVYLAGARSQEFPSDLSLEITGASFVRESSIRDSSLIIATTLTIGNPLFSPRRYLALRRFFGQISEAFEEELAIVLSQPE